jgi:hypothetical protein
MCVERQMGNEELTFCYIHQRLTETMVPGKVEGELTGYRIRPWRLC